MQNWTYDSKIELIHLPTYSPNLNLIERLWRLMRKKVMDYNYYDTFEKFRTNVLAFFQHIDNSIDELDHEVALKVSSFSSKFSRSIFKN
uniref:transposase n=1 Tax=Bernardetia sp. Wsw4-3y2 TaxID=3127471 RepID=UPI00403F38B1